MMRSKLRDPKSQPGDETADNSPYIEEIISNEPKFTRSNIVGNPKFINQVGVRADPKKIFLEI